MIRRVWLSSHVMHSTSFRAPRCIVPRAFLSRPVGDARFGHAVAPGGRNAHLFERWPRHDFKNITKIIFTTLKRERSSLDTPSYVSPNPRDASFQFLARLQHLHTNAPNLRTRTRCKSTTHTTQHLFLVQVCTNAEGIQVTTAASRGKHALYKKKLKWCNKLISVQAEGSHVVFYTHEGITQGVKTLRISALRNVHGRDESNHASMSVCSYTWAAGRKMERAWYMEYVVLRADMSAVRGNEFVDHGVLYDEGRHGERKRGRDVERAKGARGPECERAREREREREKYHMRAAEAAPLVDGQRHVSVMRK